MVKKHGKKQRARRKADRTGASYASAAAGTTHVHEPSPDLAAFDAWPDSGLGLPADRDLAARLVAAARASCRPCQESLAEQARRVSRPTVAALAGAVYSGLAGISAGVFASPTTRRWAPHAREAAARGDSTDATGRVIMMEDEQVGDLLEDALDHWAMGAPLPADLVEKLTKAPPRQQPADPMDAFRAAGIKVFTLDDLDLPDDVDTYHLAPNYGLFVGTSITESGQPMPMLSLVPETEGAGIEDLEARTDWEHWGLHGMPDMDPRWRLRVRIADRTLQQIVHVGVEGEDDIELWRAAESVSLPAEWWALLDRAQHVLLIGPVKDDEPGTLNAAGDAGELLAIVARVSFH